MKLQTILPFALSGFSSLVSSQAANGTTNSTVYTVTVGLGGLVFNPRTLVAPVGSTVQFNYYPRNHSVAQSSFDSPCAPLNNGLFSGYVPVSANESSTSFVISINNTNPIYLYCSQIQHCQSGMVAIINPSSSNSTESIQAFAARAASAPANVEPVNGVQGGRLIQNAANNASASGTSTATGTGGVAASGTGSVTASGTATGTAATATGSGSGTTSRAGGATGTTTASGTGASPSTAAGAKVLAGGILGGMGVLAGLGLSFI